MKKSVWISYDLGIKGDYPGLYRWLDSHKAKECGNNVAFLSYEYKSDLIEEIKVDLKKAIEFKNGDRIYIVYNELKESKQHSLGLFIIGNRKSSPWVGYAPMDENIADT
ncbi:MAG: hypothetical protein M0Q38_12795 [Bacteroidales bacterium]|jgi:hypothetical protein|nr:hypothetical protein [Bacteroidales bacterium]